MQPLRDFNNPLCAQVDGELWFPEKGGSSVAAKKICSQCSHITDCAEWGIKHEVYGIWGGLSVVERKKIRRQRNIKVENTDEEVWIINAQVRQSLEQQQEQFHSAS